MTRILAISDIHGHAAGMRSLLRMAAYDPGRDRLYLLGDFIDADPVTWSALREVRELTEGGARAVLGNMERWLLEEAVKKGRADGGLSERELAWLRGTPLVWREEDYLFVHAGIRPGLPLERQRPDDLTGIRQPFWGDGGELPFTVVFGHTPTFKMGAEPGELWFGRDRIGIDTGAKHGKRLTLVDLSNRVAYSCSTAAAERYGDYRRMSWIPVRAE
ncbi:metallophosphoesterase [Cohnella thermotolerans]|uniref:metallophosphoesterase n=1 Tax=Cohnella thermotolerans TaxID=329858 RepID=UPI0003FE9ED9|nr:metallophosphoesterase [Cohnella thermotolerans]